MWSIAPGPRPSGRRSADSAQVHALAESALRLAAPNPELVLEDEPDPEPLAGGTRQILEMRLRLDASGDAVRALLKGWAVAVELVGGEGVSGRDSGAADADAPSGSSVGSHIESQSDSSGAVYRLRWGRLTPRVRVLDTFDGRSELQIEVEGRGDRRWRRVWTALQRHRMRRLERRLRRSVGRHRA